MVENDGNVELFSSNNIYDFKRFLLEKYYSHKYKDKPKAILKSTIDNFYSYLPVNYYLKSSYSDMFSEQTSILNYPN